MLWDEMEWNIHIDPLAAQRVFRSGIPVTPVPLDATNEVPVTHQFVRDFSSNSSGTLGRFVREALATEREWIEANVYHAWDPLVTVVLVHPDVVTLQDDHVEIGLDPPADGQTRSLPGRSANARVAVGADPAAFTRIFTQAFARRR